MQFSAVFLDRDGTLNFDPGYLKDYKEVELLPGVEEGLIILKRELNFKLIVISNQSGIARGYMSAKDVEAINLRINKILEINNLAIDDFYYCPHHPDFNSAEACDCRKPSPNMVFKAAKKHSIDLSRSYFVGDKASDILCGINANLKTILIQENSENKEIKTLINQKKTANFIAGNFLSACEFISKDSRGGNV